MCFGISAFSSTAHIGAASETLDILTPDDLPSSGCASQLQDTTTTTCNPSRVAFSRSEH